MSDIGFGSFRPGVGSFAGCETSRRDINANTPTRQPNPFVGNGISSPALAQTIGSLHGGSHANTPTKQPNLLVGNGTSSPVFSHPGGSPHLQVGSHSNTPTRQPNPRGHGTSSLAIVQPDGSQHLQVGPRGNTPRHGNWSLALVQPDGSPRLQGGSPHQDSTANWSKSCSTDIRNGMAAQAMSSPFGDWINPNGFSSFRDSASPAQGGGIPVHSRMRQQVDFGTTGPEFGMDRNGTLRQSHMHQWENDGLDGAFGRTSPGDPNGGYGVAGRPGDAGTFSLTLDRTPCHAAGIRHITDWLKSVTGNSGGGTELRKAKLKTEYTELVRELTEERRTAASLHHRLSHEMHELRNQCENQSVNVGILAKRLDDARNAVSEELQTAASVRETLDDELACEEAQRRALEAARNGEEAEIFNRVESSAKQLDAMTAVQSSLKAQLRASTQVQTELREQIAAERGGREELQTGGEHEFNAWSAHKKGTNEIQSRELGTFSSETRSQKGTLSHVRQLQEESLQNCQEEASLLNQIRNFRDEQTLAQQNARAENNAKQEEVENLRARLKAAESEHVRHEDDLRRHQNAKDACDCERELLEEEFRTFGDAEARGTEMEYLEGQNAELHEELEYLEVQIQRCRMNPQIEQLRKERDSIENDLRREEIRHHQLTSELQNERKSFGFLCGGRKKMPTSQSASPVSAQRYPPRGGSASSSTPARETVPDDVPIGATVQILQDDTLMRRGPDMSSPRVMCLGTGAQCRVLAKGPGVRIQVQDPESGATGWVSTFKKDGTRLVAVVRQVGGAEQRNRTDYVRDDL